MPAKSKSQQKLFQMALAVRKGKLERNAVSKSVLDIVDGDMTNKQIEDFTVLECGFATPMNTIGMGNPSFPTDTTVGSGDMLMPQKKIKKKKKMKSLKEYIKNVNDKNLD